MTATEGSFFLPKEIQMIGTLRALSCSVFLWIDAFPPPWVSRSEQVLESRNSSPKGSRSIKQPCRSSPRICCAIGKSCRELQEPSFPDLDITPAWGLTHNLWRKHKPHKWGGGGGEVCHCGRSRSINKKGQRHSLPRSKSTVRYHLLEQLKANRQTIKMVALANAGCCEHRMTELFYILGRTEKWHSLSSKEWHLLRAVPRWITETNFTEW